MRIQNPHRGDEEFQVSQQILVTQRYFNPYNYQRRRTTLEPLSTTNSNETEKKVLSD